mmetsp:Transcript_19771/g.49776  ORF Transcript_19771/g.49776 Transcript_19771/m.49776 type:complete len:293 (+) Transcript_19771:5022-5900(+)
MDHQLGSLFGGFLQGRLQILQVLLQRADGGSGLFDLLHTHVVPALRRGHHVALPVQHADEGGNQIQIRSGRDVEDALLLFEEFFGQLDHRRLLLDHHLHHALLHVFVHVDLQEKLLRDGRQGLRRPLHEPIDRAAVHQTRKVSQAQAEFGADRRQGQADVQIFPAHAHVPSEHLVRRDLPHGVRALRAKFHNLHLVLAGVQIGHLPRVQDGRNLLQERLVRDLRVRKQEDHVFHLPARGDEQTLNIVVPLVQAVTLGKLDLEQLELGNVGGERGHGLTTATADTHQKRVTQG